MEGILDELAWSFDEGTGTLTLGPVRGDAGRLRTKYVGTFPWPWEHLPVRHVEGRGTIRCLGSMSGLFYESRLLEDVDGLSHLDVSHVDWLEDAFCGCESLTDISGLAGWDVSRVESTNYAFHGCTSLADLAPLSGWDLSACQDAHGMLCGCAASSTAPVSGWDLSSCHDVSNVFADCPNLEEADLSGWRTSERYRSGSWDPFCGDPRVSRIRLGPDATRRFVRLIAEHAVPDWQAVAQWDFAFGRVPDGCHVEWHRDDGAYGPMSGRELAASWTPEMAGTWVRETKPGRNARRDAHVR